ncbi:hypothetical protein EWB00_005552 [Schistosoma japonicum]|uniref:C-type lectin domain-containing protein n=1 Tax=Schistosoma japonicum TaxID=6182 RepID=A0A4Z2D141_SCHJA|nr:hypothetical protein EWB00_005552 [Schistosoma japonicum]
MSNLNIMKISCIFMISFVKLLHIECVWHPPNHIVHNEYQYQLNPHHLIYEPNRNYGESKYDEEPTVKQVKTVKYHGTMYMQVIGLRLPFHQAENYCNQAFSSKSHLTSVLSDDEWKMLSQYFELASPSKIWLGGIADLVSDQYIILRWLDKKTFKYLRFSGTEKEHWGNMLKNHQGCIVGELKNNGQGEWNIQAASCDEPKEFICKETYSDFSKKPWDIDKSRERSYMIPETSFKQSDQPPFGILSLYKHLPKVPEGSKKSLIARVSNEQTLASLATDKEQQVQSIPSVQLNTNNATMSRSNDSEPKRHTISTKKINNVTELQTTTVSTIANKNVKFVIINPTEQKTRIEGAGNDLKQGQIIEPNALENQSGPVTIYLQGVSVPGN